MLGDKDQKELQQALDEQKRFEEKVRQTDDMAKKINEPKSDKSEENKEEKAAAPKPKDDVEILSSLKSWKPEEGDDPMVSLMKELLQMMLESSVAIRAKVFAHVQKLLGQTEQAAAAMEGPQKAKVDELKETINQKMDMPNAQKTMPKELTENEKKAQKTIGLDENNRASPEQVQDATANKLNEIDMKNQGINTKISELGAQYSKDAKALSDKYQKGDVKYDDYVQQKDMLDKNYSKNDDALRNEFDANSKQYEEVRNAGEQLNNGGQQLNAPTPNQEQNLEAPELKSSFDTDTEVDFSSDKLEAALGTLKEMEEQQKEEAPELDQTQGPEPS